MTAVVLAALALVSCTHSLPPPKPYQAFVASRGSRCVTVINLATFKRERIIPLSFAPQRLFVRPKSHEIYAISGSGPAAVINFPQLQAKPLAIQPPGLKDVAFSPDGTRAYLATSAGILVLDCQHSRIFQRLHTDAPVVRVALTPDGKTLIGESAAAELIFWNAATGEKLGVVKVGKRPGSMVILPHSQKAFVADEGQNTITAVDIPSRQVFSNIEIAAPPSLLALKPDGGEIFALSPQNSTMTILDAAHDSVEQSFPTGSDPAAAVFRADSSVLYIANAGDGTVTTLEVNSRTVTASTHVGVRPVALALTPDERFLVAADSAGASLAVMRTKSSDLLTTIPAGSEPVDVVAPGWFAR
ncbi:MAG TPA: hypothetical protein VFZ08_12125 [Terriglobia bacterium]|nr:hypothetical protein [Terriglobia bacterium]